ncbi:UPF0175 family protein [Acidicapsa dinghuensis]|uniref:UPF0175 family protein n=1 Tax=Acidicapsa dinghuensis TaxID=2218256 RepID=A0ABW1EJS1_9BACT|nr:UPF0175 family protein [Acidicapsa dinghuensis]
MNLQIEIPDDLAHQLTCADADLPRVTMEALALEGYRSGRLSDGQVRRMLGFASRLQVHAFLKEHGIHLHYFMSDLDEDRSTSRGLEDISGYPPHA